MSRAKPTNAVAARSKSNSDVIDVDDPNATARLESRIARHAVADGPFEFFCEHCRSRCTKSPVNAVEFGHRDGCPRRPEHFPTGGGGRTYEDVSDDEKEMMTDGGVPSIPQSHVDNAAKHLSDALDHVEDVDGSYHVRAALAHLVDFVEDGEFDENRLVEEGDYE